MAGIFPHRYTAPSGRGEVGEGVWIIPCHSIKV
jgi:hypothetical protein